MAQDTSFEKKVMRIARQRQPKGRLAPDLIKRIRKELKQSGLLGRSATSRRATILKDK